jgi:hypothetical protein
MPGAQPSINPPNITMQPTSATEFATPSVTDAPPVKKGEPGEPPADDAELAKWKQYARDWENRAKTSQTEAKKFQTDAERYQQLQQQISGGAPPNGTPPDPLVEVNKLREELTAERTERLRESIASTTGVPAAQIQGDSEESMRASATKSLEWAQDLLQRVTGTPLTAPVSTVNGDGVPGSRTGQLSRADLKNMKPHEIMKADRDGKLDDIKAGK